MDMSEAALHLYELFAKSRLGPDEVQPHDVERTVELIVHQAQKHAEKKVLEHAMSKEDGQRLELEVNQLGQKVEHLDKKVGQLDQKVNDLDQKVNHLDQKVDRLDHKVGEIKVTLGKHDWMLNTAIAGIGAIIVMLLTMMLKFKA